MRNSGNALFGFPLQLLKGSKYFKYTIYSLKLFCPSVVWYPYVIIRLQATTSMTSGRQVTGWGQT